MCHLLFSDFARHQIYTEQNQSKMHKKRNYENNFQLSKKKNVTKLKRDNNIAHKFFYKF